MKLLDRISRTAISSLALAVAACGGGNTDPHPAGDTQKPNVSITAPAQGSTVNGMVTITGSTTDNVGVSRVAVYDNGSLVGSSLPHNWDTRAAANGPHKIIVEAYDAANNKGADTTDVSVNNISKPTAQMRTYPITTTFTAGQQTNLAAKLINVQNGRADSTKIIFNNNNNTTYRAVSDTITSPAITLTEGTVPVRYVGYMSSTDGTVKDSVVITQSLKVDPQSTFKRIYELRDENGTLITTPQTYSVDGQSMQSVNGRFEFTAGSKAVLKFAPQGNFWPAVVGKNPDGTIVAMYKGVDANGVVVAKDTAAVTANADFTAPIPLTLVNKNNPHINDQNYGLIDTIYGRKPQNVYPALTNHISAPQGDWTIYLVTGAITGTNCGPQNNLTLAVYDSATKVVQNVFETPDHKINVVKTTAPPLQTNKTQIVCASANGLFFNTIAFGSNQEVRYGTAYGPGLAISQANFDDAVATAVEEIGELHAMAIAESRNQGTRTFWDELRRLREFTPFDKEVYRVIIDKYARPIQAMREAQAAAGKPVSMKFLWEK
jgi:hypothetical protein